MPLDLPDPKEATLPFPKWLKRMINEVGTNRSIAKQLGTNASTVGSWTSGVSFPRAEFLWELAQLIRVDPTEFMWRMRRGAAAVESEDDDKDDEDKDEEKDDCAEDEECEEGDGEEGGDEEDECEEGDGCEEDGVDDGADQGDEKSGSRSREGGVDGVGRSDAVPTPLAPPLKFKRVGKGPLRTISK